MESRPLGLPFEHESLRYEQTERIKSRDSFINYNIAALAILVGAAAQGKSDWGKYLLLLVPWVSLAFGWTFIMNDLKVAQIGQYFASFESDVGWETFRRKSSPSLWIARPGIALNVQVAIFVFPGVASTFWYIEGQAGLRPIEIALILIEFAALLILFAGLISLYRFRTGRNSRRRD